MEDSKTILRKDERDEMRKKETRLARRRLRDRERRSEYRRNKWLAHLAILRGPLAPLSSQLQRLLPNGNTLTLNNLIAYMLGTVSGFPSGYVEYADCFYVSIRIGEDAFTVNLPIPVSFVDAIFSIPSWGIIINNTANNGGIARYPGSIDNTRGSKPYIISDQNTAQRFGFLTFSYTAGVWTIQSNWADSSSPSILTIAYGFGLSYQYSQQGIYVFKIPKNPGYTYDTTVPSLATDPMGYCPHDRLL